MATKKYDVACKTGSWTDKEGKTKNKYINVGTVFSNDDGRMFMVLNRTFNPAGIANPDNKEAVILSFFEPKVKESSAETPKEEVSGWAE